MAPKKPIHAPIKTAPIASGPNEVQTNRRKRTISELSVTEYDVAEDFIAIGGGSTNNSPATASKRKTPEAFKRDMDRSRKALINPNRAVPWAKKPYNQDVMIALHEEILDFVEYSQPTAREHSQRLEIIGKLKNMVKGLWPLAEVKTFGSFGTGLYTPTSDIDVVVFGNWPKNPVHTVANALASQRFLKVSSITRVTHARVPIVKFTEKTTGVDVDISFNQEGGVTTVAMVKSYIRQYPCLFPLTVLMKHFLSQRKLNEPFNGGVGSYALTLMVLHFLQLHPGIGNERHSINCNLGVLLIDFLELYGHAFNHEMLGISVRGNGKYFHRNISPNFRNKSLPNKKGTIQYNLAIEDPQSRENNVGSSSKRYADVRASFAQAHTMLTSYIMNKSTMFPSALSCVVAVNEDFIRKRNENQSAKPHQKASSHSRSNNPQSPPAGAGSVFMNMWRSKESDPSASPPPERISDKDDCTGGSDNVKDTDVFDPSKFSAISNKKLVKSKISKGKRKGLKRGSKKSADVSSEKKSSAKTVSQYGKDKHSNNKVDPDGMIRAKPPVNNKKRKSKKVKLSSQASSESLQKNDIV
eukprot:CFRG6047T1